MRDTERLKRAVAVVGLFVFALWAIRVGEAAFGMSLGTLGVRPGEPWGLVGVVTAPLVHGSFGHLFSNTPPLLFLGTLMLYGYPRASRLALPLIWIGSGLGVWLFARASTHIGISGVNLGMLMFVFVAGVRRRDRPAIALALAAAFLYGGMIWGVLPLRPGVSFESHLAGAVAGLVAAFLLARADPVPAQQRYAWEDENEADARDPAIGDLWRDAAAPEEPPVRDPDAHDSVGMRNRPPPSSAELVDIDEILALADERSLPSEAGREWRRRLRPYLERCAAEGRTVTYDQASRELGIEPPQRIHKLTEALERTMTEDAGAGRAFRAAVVVSKTGGVPQRGFFLHAGALGRYRGPETGDRATDFHARELARLRREVVPQSAESDGRREPG